MEGGSRRGSISHIRIAILVLVLYSAISHQPTVSCSTEGLRLYVISCEACEGYRDRVDVLRVTFPNTTIVFYEIDGGENARRFNEISVAVGETLYMPLVGVFLDDDLVSIASGGLSPEGWRKAVQRPAKGIAVFITDVGGEATLMATVTDPDKVNTISRLFVEEDVGFAKLDLSHLTLVVASAAVIDAINPCCIGVFTVLLTLVFYGAGNRAVLRVGLAFTLGLFIAYLTLGLGLGRLFRQLPGIEYLVSAFAILLGVARILEALGMKVKHLPFAFSSRISRVLEGVTTPRTGLMAGALTGFLLLPCSSAPYFIVINMVSDMPSIIGLALLVFYNVIIVAPFITLTVIVHGLLLTTMDLKQWSIESRRLVNALIGVAQVALGVVNLLL